MVVAALWMDGKIILMKTAVFDASIWESGAGWGGLGMTERTRGSLELWSSWTRSLNASVVCSIYSECSEFIYLFTYKQTFIKSHQWPGTRLKLGLWSGNRGIWPPGGVWQGLSERSWRTGRIQVSQKRQGSVGVGELEASKGELGQVSPTKSNPSIVGRWWDRRQIRMWKPRLTLLVLEGRKSFLEDSGKVMVLPSQRISKEVSWVCTFQEKGVTGNRVHAFRENQWGVVCSLSAYRALLPSPVITRSRPWETPLWDLAAIHPMSPLPSPSMARRSPCNQGWLSLELGACINATARLSSGFQELSLVFIWGLDSLSTRDAFSPPLIFSTVTGWCGHGGDYCWWMECSLVLCRALKGRCFGF